jgi:hypothetical protein
MGRTHDSEHYDLSETEKRDLIKLIEPGKPFPEKYRLLLWNGKSREVCAAILPFHPSNTLTNPGRHLRERMAKLPHSARPRTRIKEREPHLGKTRPLRCSREGD